MGGAVFIFHFFLFCGTPFLIILVCRFEGMDVSETKMSTKDYL